MTHGCPDEQRAHVALIPRRRGMRGRSRRGAHPRGALVDPSDDTYLDFTFRLQPDVLQHGAVEQRRPLHAHREAGLSLMPRGAERARAPNLRTLGAPARAAADPT